MNRPGRRRLNIDLPENTYLKVKESADKQGQTLTVYITRALWEKIKRENGDKELIKVLK